MSVIAVDASALLAILLDETDADVYLSKLVAASKALISPVNWWEVHVHVRNRYGDAGEARAAVLLDRLCVVVEPVTLAQAEIALHAFRKFQGRPARLNMGDCFAFALAQSKQLPLLYKGNDFKHTDVPVA